MAPFCLVPCARPALNRTVQRESLLAFDCCREIQHLQPMTNTHGNNILDAIESLKRGEREAAVRLLKREFAEGAASGQRWASVARLASNIGEVELALEAWRRFGNTEPIDLARKLSYWGELANLGRSQLARTAIDALDERARGHPAVLHFYGTLASQEGDFVAAERYYREALAATPYLPQTWFALAMIKQFSAGDPDLALMEQLLPAMRDTAPDVRARYLYGLAKARHDIGDYAGAFALYDEGAALRRTLEKFDLPRFEAFAQATIRDFTADNLAKLKPSGASGNDAILVTGLPRSGTTLVEQLLTSHSQVSDGAEVNLFRAALSPTVNFSFAGARAYQARSESADPWGDVARDYMAMLEQRFQTSGRVVDKTLCQSHFMGLLLHSMPDTRVVWMRRNPEDAAFSCFRSFFSSPLPWTWSLSDIGNFFRIEDQLFAHFAQLFPDRILPVQYEDLASAPTDWIPRILAHAGLAMEPGVLNFHENKRSVRTASVQQVRSPISTGRIGLSRKYDLFLEPFRQAYSGPGS